MTLAQHTREFSVPHHYYKMNMNGVPAHLHSDAFQIPPDGQKQ